MGMTLRARPGVARFCGGLAAAGLVALAAAPARPIHAQPAPPAVEYLDQGWSPADRDFFYTTEQGSHLIPYAWFKALRRSDADAAFAGDQLARYGYLRNDSPANASGLPVGFVVDARDQPAQLGMTCAACHTGQVEYLKAGAVHAIRIDGAPAAAADFQAFLTDLDAAAQATLDQPARFEAFERAALAAGYSPGPAGLRAELSQWVAQFHAFMAASLPAHAWGPGRLDAFGMIFNRVAARDLGVEANFARADAPVSYPFIWNAHRQDHTQWNGGVPNGSYIQAMARNTGEVFGVFADFSPSVAIPPLGPFPTQLRFRPNSVDFDHLQSLEEKIAALKPPPWPAAFPPINRSLAAQGKVLYHQNCARCHEDDPAKLAGPTWVTPVQWVGTDPKMATNAARVSATGPYEGALNVPPPPFNARLGASAPTTDVLKTSVLGAMADDAFVPLNPASGVLRAFNRDLADGRLGAAATPRQALEDRLQGLYAKAAPEQPGAAYESRVLYGVWATAPYLHNGSVPNLWQLLTPPAQRKGRFLVGSRLYDPKNVGLAIDRSPSRNGRFVADPAVGDGNGGHDYGTHLSAAQRWALIEYLKTL